MSIGFVRCVGFTLDIFFHQGKESQENLQIQYRLEMFDSGLNVEKENSGMHFLTACPLAL
jgi:hypothetical protein